MAGLAVTAAALIVAWTGFLYVRLRMPNGFFLLLFKLSAGALAVPIALVGLPGLGRAPQQNRGIAMEGQA